MALYPDRTDLPVSPSRWVHRGPLIAVAVIGCGIAVYLALYQIGLVRDVWDPIFGSGSERVLRSSLARRFPIPDAALGALAYLAEIATASIGGAERWRSMPWIVVAFGVVAAGLAAAALVLIAAQVFVVHAGCALCLASAVISLVIGWTARTEVFATLGAVRRRLNAGESFGEALGLAQTRDSRRKSIEAHTKEEVL